MKVGILTYHNTVNYGAALQAYATQEKLVQLGIAAEIINYTNAYRRSSYSILQLMRRGLRDGQKILAVKVLLGTPLIKLRKKRFAQFYRKRLKLSSKEYTTADQLKADPPQYDCYIVGSDQVWNYDHNGCDMSYLLDFVEDADKTMSYASSFGLSSINPVFQCDYARLLGRIRSLSVREKDGAELVKSLTGREASVVLDPVFLLTKEQWENVADNSIGIKNPFILIYTTKRSHYENFLRVAGQMVKGAHIAHLTTSTRLKDFFEPMTKVVFAASPGKFLGLIKNAGLVLTSSFHGTALSVIFEKQFVSFLAGNEGKDARIVGLLDQLGLNDRIFSYSMTPAQVDNKICYKAVQRRLDLLRKESIGFLENAINISNKKSECVTLAAKDQCTGCMACSNICEHAITIKTDEEGFARPSVKKHYCIECGRCEKICPTLHSVVPERLVEPLVFACAHRDEKFRLESASGGLFMALAQLILLRSGAVFGAVMTDGTHVEHRRVERHEDLHLMQKSKYVQSNIGRTLLETKDFLESGRPVLFSGLPCQIAGLYNFLGKDYHNLYTIDLLCKGAPSPGVFQAFIRSLETHYNSPIRSYAFREKKPESSQALSIIKLADDRRYKIPLTQTTFGSGFSTDLFMRLSCYRCRYRNTNRIGDLSAGDFWGLGSDSSFYRERQKGVTLLLINSIKGKMLFESAAGSLLCEKRLLSEAIACSSALRSKITSNRLRTGFFTVYKRNPNIALSLFTLPHRIAVCLRNSIGITRKIPLIKILQKSVTK